jgi:hypothetical protein
MRVQIKPERNGNREEGQHPDQPQNEHRLGKHGS